MSKMKRIRNILFVALVGVWAFSGVEVRAFDGCCIEAYNWCAEVCQDHDGCQLPICGVVYGYTDAFCWDQTMIEGGPVCQY
jgi:hypothetical protein